MIQQRLSIALHGVTLCGAVGLFKGVVYVTCGLSEGHGEPCAYAEAPTGSRSIDREPVDPAFVEPVYSTAATLQPLRELLRIQGRTA